MVGCWLLHCVLLLVVVVRFCELCLLWLVALSLFVADCCCLSVCVADSCLSLSVYCCELWICVIDRFLLFVVVCCLLLCLFGVD